MTTVSESGLSAWDTELGSALRTRKRMLTLTDSMTLQCQGQAAKEEAAGLWDSFTFPNRNAE